LTMAPLIGNYYQFAWLQLATILEAHQRQQHFVVAPPHFTWPLCVAAACHLWPGKHTNGSKSCGGRALFITAPLLHMLLSLVAAAATPVVACCLVVSCGSTSLRTLRLHQHHVPPLTEMQPLLHHLTKPCHCVCHALVAEALKLRMPPEWSIAKPGSQHAHMACGYPARTWAATAMAVPPHITIPWLCHSCVASNSTAVAQHTYSSTTVSQATSHGGEIATMQQAHVPRQHPTVATTPPSHLPWLWACHPNHD